MTRRRPSPSATRIGSPSTVEAARAARSTVCSSSRPSIIEIILRGGSSAIGAHADEAAVAQHRDSVGDLVNLIDEMGDEDDGDAARLEVAHDLEKKRGLLGVEARGRLVEHQNAGVVLERAGDRHELLDRDGVGPERPLDVDLGADIEALQTLARAFSAPCPIR